MNAAVLLILLILPGINNHQWLLEPHPKAQASIVVNAAENPEIISSNEYFGTQHHLPSQNTQPLARSQTNQQQWVLLVLFISLGALSLAQYLFPSRMQQFFKASLGMRFFNQMEREGNFFNETITWLLFLNYVAVMALLMTKTWTAFSDETVFNFSLHPGWIFLLFLGLLSVFYFLKGLLTGSVAWVFRTQEINSVYLKNIYLINQLSGIILLPLVVFSALNASLTGIMISWILVAAAGLIKIGRNFLTGFQMGGFSAYYLILYLCAIEFTPLVILIKAVSGFVFD